MPKVPRSKVTESKKAIHPNSRKALTQEKHRTHKARVDVSRHQKSLKRDTTLDKYLWFQTNLDDTKNVFTKSDLTQLVLDYMKRFHEEIEQISIVNSVGFRSKTKPQHSSRLDSIKFTQDREQSEFSSIGIEVPNLMKKGNVELFKAWGGEMRFFENIEKIRICQRDAEKCVTKSKELND